MKNSENAVPEPVEPEGTSGLPAAESAESTPQERPVSVVGGLTVEETAFSGPLPPLSMYEGYERAFPGSANRILTLAEEEQRRRGAWETRALNAAVGERKRGQWIGAALAVFCIAGAVYLAANEKELVAAVLAGVSAVCIVGRFLPARRG